MNKLIFILLFTISFSKKLRLISLDEEFSTYVDTLIERHNYYRSLQQNTPNLEKSQDLCDIAQAYAEELAEKGIFQHSGNSYNGEWMGENLYVTYSPGRPRIDSNTPADNWYSEISQYNFTQSVYVPGAGHFTQMIWKSSQYIGCGFARGKYSSYNAIQIVCNYYPGGNINSFNYFKNNVLPLK